MAGPRLPAPGVGIASPILGCCYLRKWLFLAGLVGGAWSLPFLLGIGLLGETSGEEAEMTMPILHMGTETKPPMT